MELRMHSPLFCKPALALASVHGPPVLTLVELERYTPPYGLRKAFAELQRRNPELWPASEVPPSGGVADPWAWAQREIDAGTQPGLTIDELAAARCCVQQAEGFLRSLNRALFDWEPGKAPEVFQPWEVVAGCVLSAVWKLHRATANSALSGAAGEQAVAPAVDARRERVERCVCVTSDEWEWLQAQIGLEVCFAGFQSVAAVAPKQLLATADDDSVVPCILEFNGDLAAHSADVSSLCDNRSEPELLLPPYLRCRVVDISSAFVQGDLGTATKVFCVKLSQPWSPCLLARALDAPVENALAAALLVGLHSSRNGAVSELLESFLECFQLLASLVTVRNSEAVGTVWKSYWECLLEDLQAPKKLSEKNFSGVIDVASVFVLDYFRAARGVTKRAWGCESCVNQRAMDEEQARRTQLVEKRKREAVDVARESVLGLQLETLTDPESFLKYLTHDPVQALGTMPAAARVYLESGPAQRVLMFAKLLGLVAVAGGLLRGDPRVQAAFDSPFAAGQARAGCHTAELEQSAQRVADLIWLQRAQVARCRLLVVAGPPDAGKTTLLREAFGLRHLAAGLSPDARTEQIQFEPHPSSSGDLSCPVYLVDTPGLGDGDQLHRNDMARVLLGASSWLPGGFVLAWVLRAGRNERREADGLLLRVVAAGVAVRVVVTHIDRLFEDRYREIGPQWKEGELRGVPHRDPRWAERRKMLMRELREEVEAPVRAAVGGERPLELAYACLSGWMAGGGEAGDEDDEFAMQAPWPWAKQELGDYFEVMDGEGTRNWLGSALGL